MCSILENSSIEQQEQPKCVPSVLGKRNNLEESCGQFKKIRNRKIIRVFL